MNLLGRLWRHRDGATVYFEGRAALSRHPLFPFKEVLEGGKARCISFILTEDGRIINPVTGEVEGEVRWYRRRSRGVIFVRAGQP